MEIVFSQSIEDTDMDATLKYNHQVTFLVYSFYFFNFGIPYQFCYSH